MSACRHLRTQVGNLYEYDFWFVSFVLCVCAPLLGWGAPRRGSAGMRRTRRECAVARLHMARLGVESTGVFIAPGWSRRVLSVERRGCAVARFGVVCAWCRRVLVCIRYICICVLGSRILCRV